jgi:hypothetical protein
LTRPIRIIILKSNSIKETAMKEWGWLFGVIIFLSIIVLLPELSFAEEFELQVIVQKANVRAKPDINSEIVTQVSLGTMLKSDLQEGNWYRVLLPPDETGVVKRAFINNSVVEVIVKTQPAVKKEQIEKTEAKVEEKPALPPKKMADESRTGQAQQLLPKPEKSAGMGYGLRLYGAYDFFLGQNSINDGWLGKNDFRSDSLPTMMATLSFDGELEPLKLGNNFGGEFFFNLNPYLGFGLGAGYIYAYKEGSLSSTDILFGSKDVDTFAQKISVPYVTLTLYGGLPLGKRIRLVPYLGGGLYYGAVTVEYKNTYDDPLFLYEYFIEESWTAHSIALGFHGGLNVEIQFMRNIGLYIGAGGLLASFKELVADLDWLVWDNYGTSDSGTDKDFQMWSVNFDYGYLGLGEYPAYSLDETEPSGIGVSNVKPGVISISQFRFVIGIVIYLSR